MNENVEECFDELVDKFILVLQTVVVEHSRYVGLNDVKLDNYDDYCCSYYLHVDSYVAIVKIYCIDVLENYFESVYLDVGFVDVDFYASSLVYVGKRYVHCERNLPFLSGKDCRQTMSYLIDRILVVNPLAWLGI